MVGGGARVCFRERERENMVVVVGCDREREGGVVGVREGG